MYQQQKSEVNETSKNEFAMQKEINEAISEEEEEVKTNANETI